MAAKKSVTPDPEPEVGTPEPVLKISTIAPVRPYIEIDDNAYELRMMRDFGIAKQQELNRDGREFGDLWNSPKRLTDSQQKRLKLLLERIFKQVMIVPKDDDIIERLEDADKADVVLHFTLAPLRKMMAEAMAQKNQESPEEADEDS